ncbi:MAG: hypothetical protein AAGD14_18870 [Planctomycetota bacterium]
MAGALLDAELRALIERYGFTGFEISSNGGIYDGAPQETWAGEFDTTGMQFRARLA